MVATSAEMRQGSALMGRFVEWLTGTKPEPPPDPRSLGVLVVEDDQSVGKVIKVNIGLEDLEVTWARDLHTARQALRTSRFGTILLDMNLPDGTGLDLLKFIRQDIGVDTPVIVLSGFKQEDSIVRALELGANDYMIKPFSPKELMARIHKVRGD